MKSNLLAVRRLAAIGAAVIATAGLVGSVGAAPAAAALPAVRCQVFTTGPTFDADEATVTGGHFRRCDPDIFVPLPVTITRNGKGVAEGTGIAVYHCRGTAVGEFRVNASRPRSFPCG